MSDDAKPEAKPDLPGNHGQFGANDATDDAKPLEDHASPADAVPTDVEPDAGTETAQGPKQTNAGERS